MKSEMKTTEVKFWSGLNIALGGASFLMFLDEAWFWVGLASAIFTLIIGNKGRKSPDKQKQICSIISIALAISAALIYLLLMFAAGYSIPNLL